MSDCVCKSRKVGKGSVKIQRLAYLMHTVSWIFVHYIETHSKNVSIAHVFMISVERTL